MHDIRLIREDPEGFDAALARRGIFGPSFDEVKMVLSDTYATARARKKYITVSQDWTGSYSRLILTLDEKWKKDTRRVEVLRSKQKSITQGAAQAKKSGDHDGFDRAQAEARRNRSSIYFAERRLRNYDEARKALLGMIPNLPLDDVPDGVSEDDNVEIRRWGTPREMDFPAREHFDIPAVASLFDMATAAKLSGARFMVLRGALARVHRALAQFMLDLHTGDHGLTEVWAPVLVRPEAMYGTNQLPKFAEDSYQTTNGWWLIPTSEVTMTNFAAGEVIDVAALPIRMTAHSQCFRSEAGSAGKDTTGILRQHQFEKVEMVTLCRPENAAEEHARMTRCAEAVLERLDLPYRTVVLCTGDMGFGAQRTHDIEVWLPGQGKYREISSVSTMGDFQARRMNARYRPAGGKPEFLASLNGSGLAVGRTLIAVLENGQQADGSVVLPAALSPWLGGARGIDPQGRLV